MKLPLLFLFASYVLTEGGVHNDVCQSVESMTDTLAKMKLTYKELTDAIFSKSSVFECRRYFFALNEVQNVTYAVRVCEALGGYLAEVDTAVEFNFLQEHARTMPNLGEVDVFWLGGTDEKDEGQWVNRRTGNPIGYTGWMSGQPDNANGEDCQSLSRWSGTDYLMNDVKCHHFRDSPVTPMRYVCEIPLDYEM